MKAVSSKITKGIQLESILNCADNSGARKLRVIAVKGYKGVHRRLPKAGVGDVIICSVVKGSEKLRKTVVYAVVVRQRRAYRRPNGVRIKFEDNAAVLVNPKTFEPQASEIRTAIAKEAVERFSAIGKIASIVV